MKNEPKKTPEEETVENKDITQEDVEEAVEKQVEVEDLSDVDASIGDEGTVIIAANERWQSCTSYQRLYVRKTALKASVAANKAVGNTQGEQKFQKELDDVELQIAHCLRGIKAIDKEFPKAKAKMTEMFKNIKS